MPTFRRPAVLVVWLTLALVGCGGAQRPMAAPAPTPTPTSVPAPAPASAPAPAPASAPSPAGTGTAPAVVAAPQPEPFPHLRSDLPVDPAVVWGRLDNGLRWCLLPNQQPKDKVSIRMQVLAGSRHEEQRQRGIAHYLEHLGFNGTTNYPPDQLVATLQGLGLAFGQHTNAHTSFDETVYKLDLPDPAPETIATGLQVMADWAGGMLLLPAEIEKERGVILAEMRDRDSPGRRQWESQARALYPGLIIPDRLPIGLRETVSAAGVAEIRSFYDDWYRPERLILAVVGSIDPVAVEQQVRARFSGLAARAPARAEPPLGELRAAELAIHTFHEPEAEETSLSLMRVRVEAEPLETAAERGRRLLEDLGGALLARRLGEIAERDAAGPLLSAQVHSYYWLDLFHAVVETSVRPGRLEAAVPVLEQELRRFIEHGPTPAELAVAKANLLAQLDAAVAQAANRTNAALAHGLYQSVSHHQVFSDPRQERDQLRPLIEAATAESVRQALAACWSTGHQVLSASGRDRLPDPAESRLRDAWLASRAVPVASPALTAASAWGYGERPAAGAVASEDMAHFDIVQIACANAARINLKRTDFKPGEVLVQLRLELPVAARQAGLDELANAAFLAGGLGKHSLQELRDVLAGSTVRLRGPEFNDNGCVFVASCLPKDLELCLQQLRAYLVDPGWRSEAEAKAKSAWLEGLRSLETNLDAQVARTFQALAVHGAPHRRQATLAEAEAVGFPQVRAWLEPHLREAPLTLSIIGDIDPGAARELALAYIGSLPERHALVPMPDPHAPGALVEVPPLPAGEHRIEVGGAVPRAVVRMAWPTDDFYDIATTRRLGLLADVLGERLRERLREEFGQAYSPQAGRYASETYDGFGYILASAGVAPENAATAARAMRDLASGLAREGVSEVQLSQVKIPLIKSLGAMRQQNGYWLNSVMARAQQQPFRIDWARSMEADFAAVTSAELSALARRFLVDAKVLQVTGVAPGAPGVPAAPAPPPPPATP